ncbi:ATP-binding protein [Alkalibaculum bacchi]|uniref:ATP-binding protein n=1 Tax=Alkalibaculum bacchi TaxID=645887 RepID=UPI0026EE19D7|nr:AAA family ATPase [Alkalibaculum bacchi]
MNIEEAKEQIKNSVRIYLKKDEYGDYKIPLVRQRPVFLLGPPGIGKTAIMEQIAQELGVALVSYSMTHHTRQSALGLPFIEKKIYGNQEYSVSEYTMSEIIATVYETMEESKVKEGILFLDEINCVSETLAPAMLQFLQYKIFGRHKVPEGWVVVTAGNPPQYNKSVREFDIVTMDRLKILEVTEQYEIWKKYASKKGIHGSILTYLDIKKDDFYLVETAIGEKSYVTARGWEDLSEAIALYEEENLTVDEVLVSQYIRNRKIAKNYAIYYDLYQKYKKDYKIGEILEGYADENIKKRAKEAKFDERLSLLNLLLEAMQRDIRKNLFTESYLMDLVKVLKQIKIELNENTKPPIDILEEHIDELTLCLEKEKKANSLSYEKKRNDQLIIKILEENKTQIKNKNVTQHLEVYEYIKKNFDEAVKNMREETSMVQKKMHHMFDFVEQVYGEGQEIFILVTELTADYYSAKFISSKGSEDYYKYNKRLMFLDRQKEILQELDGLAEN